MVSLMWAQFGIAVVFSAALLLVPGFIFLKAFRCTNLYAAICAPLISVLLFCVAGIVLPPLGNVGAYVVIGLSLGVSLVAWGVALLCRGDRDEGFLGKTSVSHSVYGFSAIVSVLVLGLTFVVSLNGPDSFSQHSDNMAHLGKIKAMIESGYFSTLSTSSYNAVFDSSQIPFEGVGFYPSAWHVVCALVGSVLDCSPGLTENAVNFVLAALVLPCAMCLLGDRVSRGDKRFSLACGAFSCIFAAFPIGLYLFGPLYPNAASYCCLPILLVIFLDFLRGVEEKKRWVSYLILFVMGSISIAFLQPNGVFVAAVFLAPYLVYRTPRIVSRYALFARFAKGGGIVVLRVLLVVFIAAIWVALNRAPFMQGVVTFGWPAICSISDAVAGAATLSLRPGVPQYLLAALMWLGFVYTFLNRRYFWLSAVLLFSLFSYVVCAATDGPLKMLLTGFWYNDQWRASATVYFAAIPLASLGATVLVKAIKALVGPKEGKLLVNSSTLYILMILSIVFAVSFPSYNIAGEYKKTALGEASHALVELNNQTEENALTEKEDAFVARVADYVGGQALVLNFPDDGSAYGYMKYDINLYYKSYLTSGETRNSELIRTGLYSISGDMEVSAAVDEVGAEYVMILERNGFVDNGSYQWSLDGSYAIEDWLGILEINDNTPGFEVVLSEGDMRLYRIDRNR